MRVSYLFGPTSLNPLLIWSGALFVFLFWRFSMFPFGCLSALPIWILHGFLIFCLCFDSSAFSSLFSPSSMIKQGILILLWRLSVVLPSSFFCKTLGFHWEYSLMKSTDSYHWLMCRHIGKLCQYFSLGLWFFDLD